MSPYISFKELPSDANHLYIQAGPLLNFLYRFAAADTKEYVRNGGYTLARRILTSSGAETEACIQKLEQSGLRGRAGGGFPAGQKWRIVANRPEDEKYVICNANSAQPGGIKERLLLGINPHLVVEISAIATFTVGARKGFLAMPERLQERKRIECAIDEARQMGMLGPNAFGTNRECDLFIYPTPDAYVLGEETALMEVMEGRAPQPRAKPPLPTAKGLFGAPTLVNNIETLLHAAFVLAEGPEQFRRAGLPNAPGTMVFSVVGHVQQPGIYEMPLGTTIRELIFGAAGGTLTGRPVKAVFPGGICSAVLVESELDTPLDFDSMAEVESDLGSGVVIVIEDGTDMVDVTIECAKFLHQVSCGKCQACKDGTYRTVVMLTSLERLDESYVDRRQRPLPMSQRSGNFTIINQPTPPVSYTDSYTGLDRIEQLCEFFKYRGDCHHSYESARSIQRLLNRFKSEFTMHMKQSKVDQIASHA